MRHLPLFVLALTLGVSACKNPQYVPTREMPARGPDDSAQQATVERYDGFTAPEDTDAPMDSSSVPLRVFAEEILLGIEGRRSIGCLPLVLTDPRASEPWVPEYGVDLSDQAAGWIRRRGLETQVLTSTEMGARLDETLGERATLSTLENVRRHGEHLDVEMVVFGAMRRDNNVGRQGRDVLTVDVQCYDFVSEKIVTRTSFEVPSDDAANARIWQLVQRKSSWAADPE